MTFVWAMIGWLLGMSFGSSSMQTRVQRRLREFTAARNLRLVDGTGADVQAEELASALRKD